MASGSSMMNGDINHPRGGQASGTGNLASLEETIQQMNTLIKENRELKGEKRYPFISLYDTYMPNTSVNPTEALKQTNLTMKERFEGLSTWKEKQKEEREFLEKRLQEAKARLSAADAENETLKKRVQELEKSGAEVRRVIPFLKVYGFDFVLITFFIFGCFVSVVVFRTGGVERSDRSTSG